jgi:hypothetical protein
MHYFVSQMFLPAFVRAFGSAKKACAALIVGLVRATHADLQKKIALIKTGKEIM